MVGNLGEGGKNEGRGGGEGTKGIKKGPWTAAEDAILMEYVKKYGEGNWNAVQKKTGLARCGKSCRLRWANHLRPNLKKGSFSPEEERVIIELHAKLGNKWARMAAQLPGRTDNEIKNYWNTRMKRRQRAGLPLYPLELQKEVAAFHLHHHQNHFRSEPHHPPSYSSLLSPSQPQKPNFNHSLSLFNPMNISLAVDSLLDQRDSAFFTSPISHLKLLSGTNGASGFSLPVSPSFMPVSSSFFTQNPQTQPVSQKTLNLNHATDTNFNCNSSFSSMIIGSPFEQVMETELPSIQTPPRSPTTASSGTSVGNYEMPTQTPQANSGLLDALLMEAAAMARNETVKDDGSSPAVSKKEKQVGEDEAVENHSDVLSSSQSSTGVKTVEDPAEEMESMDEDLMSLLNNFPSTMPLPLPEWYPSCGGGSGDDEHNVQASYLSTTNLALDVQGNGDSSAPPIASPEACWNNRPAICQQLR